MPLSRSSVLVGLFIALMLGASAVAAQSVARIRIALVNELSVPEARAEILRFSEPGQRDVILLRAGTASPLDLAAALVLYRASVRRTPVRAGLTGRITMTAQRGAEQLSPEAIRDATRMLRRVQAAASARIGNLGLGRWEEFDVAP